MIYLLLWECLEFIKMHNSFTQPKTGPVLRLCWCYRFHRLFGRGLWTDQVLFFQFDFLKRYSRNTCKLQLLRSRDFVPDFTMMLGILSKHYLEGYGLVKKKKKKKKPQLGAVYHLPCLYYAAARPRGEGRGGGCWLKTTRKLICTCFLERGRGLIWKIYPYD